jgi:hypothetical protein
MGAGPFENDVTVRGRFLRYLASASRPHCVQVNHELRAGAARTDYYVDAYPPFTMIADEATRARPKRVTPLEEPEPSINSARSFLVAGAGSPVPSVAPTSRRRRQP